MLNFLSFLVFLYVLGHFKQKKIQHFFSPDTDLRIAFPHPINYLDQVTHHEHRCIDCQDSEEHYSVVARWYDLVKE